MRCPDFYRKWKKCGNFCEKNPDTARGIEKYLDIILSFPAMSALSERALRPLIREKNPNIRDNALVSIEKALEEGKNPATGQFSKEQITERDISRVLEKIRDRQGVVSVVSTSPIVDEIETDAIIECPECFDRFRLVHNNPNNTHRFIQLDKKEVIVGTRITDELDHYIEDIAAATGKSKATITREAIIKSFREKSKTEESTEL